MRALVLAAALVACAPPASHDPEPLAGTRWMLADRGTEGATITFEGANAHGGTPCNAWSARVQINGEALKFRDVIATERACEPAIMETEAFFLDALHRTASARIESVADSQRLILLDLSGGEIASFRPGP